MDTRTHTDESGIVWTLARTLAARADAMARMAATSPLARATDGTWHYNAHADAGAHADAREAHAYAARMARTITLTPRGVYPPDARTQAATRRTHTLAAERLATRTRHARTLAHAAHVAACDTERPRVATLSGYSVNRTRGTWHAHGCTGRVQMARWHVRAYMDTIARERIAAERARELSDSRRVKAGGCRTDLAWQRAMAAGTLAYTDTDPSAWSEYTPREIVNARETRAAERGRGIIARGPSSARVTTRDHYAPAGTLRMLRTCGVATHDHASGHDYTRLLQMILTRPRLATYRQRAHAGDAGRVLPVHVHVATDGTHAHAATLSDAPQNAAERQAAADHAAMAAMGTIHDAAA